MEEKSVKSGLQEIEVNGYSVIAINLRTVEDVDAIIRRCEAIKQNMIDGLEFGKCYVTNKEPDYFDYINGKRVVVTSTGDCVLPPFSNIVIHLNQ